MPFIKEKRHAFKDDLIMVVMFIIETAPMIPKHLKEKQMTTRKE